MKISTLSLAVVFTGSLLAANLMVADEFAPRGGFLVARLAAKRLKKMRQNEHFSGADANKDGALSKEELKATDKVHGNAIDDETFKKIDRNGDGLLSHEECENFHKEMEKTELK